MGINHKCKTGLLTNIFETDIIAIKDIIYDREVEDISILSSEKGINQGG